MRKTLLLIFAMFCSASLVVANGVNNVQAKGSVKYETLAIPGTIQAGDYSDQYGLTINDHIGYVNDGDWVEYSIDVESAGFYNMKFHVATSNDNATCEIAVDGDSISTFVSPNTGSFTTYSDDSIVVPLPEGVHTLRLTFKGNAFNTEYLEVSNFSNVKAIPGTIQAEDYSDQSGLTIGEHIGGVNQDDWVNYIVDVAAAGSYNLIFHVASLNWGGASCDVKVDGEVIGTFDCPSTGSWTNYTDAALEGLDLPEGQHELQLYFTGSTGFNIEYIVCESNIPSYDVSFNITDGVTAINGATVSFNGTDYTANESGNVTISDVIDGTYSYSVEAEGYRSQTDELTVNGANKAIDITMQAVYSVIFTVTNGTSAINGGTVSFDGVNYSTNENGVLTITDVEAGTYNYNVSATGYNNYANSVTVSEANVNLNVTLEESAAPSYSIIFNITDGISAISGATVTFNGTDYTTNESGEVTVNSVEDGTYNYTISATGFLDTTNTVTVSGAGVTLNIEMEAVHSVTFTITDGTSAISGGTVTFNSDNYTTNENGVVIISGLENGTYNYTISATGYTDSTNTVTINGTDVTLDIALESSTVISYSVVFNITNGSSAINLATVTFNDIDYPTNENGSVTVNNVQDGTYTYSVSAVGYYDTTSTVTINGDNVTLNIEMNAIPLTYTVSFTVTDGLSAVSGTTVEFNGTEYLADANGIAEVDSVLDGTYSYTVSATGFIDATGSVTVSGADVELDIVLEAVSEKHSVVFNITDSTEAISGASLLFNGISYTADDKGVVTVTDVEDGTYAYVISAEGYFDITDHVTVNGDDVALDIVMKPDAPEVYSVTFNITDGASAINGATVSFNSQDYSTDASGSVTIASVEDGTYNYVVSAAGYSDASGSIIVDGENVTKGVAMEASAAVYSVTFNITDGTAAISGAVITFNSVDYSADESGSLTIVNVEDGSYSYVVSAEGYGEVTGSTIVNGANVTEDITLKLVGVDSQLSNEISIYPNPANQYITIGQDYDQVVIYDMCGNVIKSVNRFESTINIDELNNGIYIVSVNSNGLINTVKLIVE